MIKLLHFADLHLGSSFGGFSAEQGAVLAQRQRLALSRLSELRSHLQCQAVLITGDLFEGKRVPVSLLRTVAATLKDMEVPVYITPGNHDYLGTDSPYDKITWPDNVFIFRQETLSPMVCQALDLRIWGAGYYAMDCPPLLEGFRASGRETYEIAAFHGDPMGLEQNYSPVTRQQVADSKLQYVALGHIHKAGKFTAGQSTCAWPGCPVGRNFRELGPKGALVVTLEPGKPAQVNFVDLGLPTFRELVLELGQDPARQLLDALGDDRDTAWRVILTGEQTPDLQDLRSRVQAFCLELVDQTSPAMDPWEKVDQDSLEGHYFRLLQKALESAGTEEEAQVATLAARISGQLLQGEEVALP